MDKTIKSASSAKAAEAKRQAAEQRAERETENKLYPAEKGFYPAKPCEVGGVVLDTAPIEYNKERYTATLSVRNTGDRPIQVGSHFHFFEVNRYLEFEREKAFGCHLNIPATTAVRFEPGDEKEVEVVAYSGKRRIIGFNNLVKGYAGDEDAPMYLPARKRAFEKMHQRGFKCRHTMEK